MLSVISLSVAIRARPPSLRSLQCCYFPVNKTPYVQVIVRGCGQREKHMSKAVGLFSNGSTPGRGKAEYGGLSLQSARLGYSTVISLCLLKKPHESHT